MSTGTRRALFTIALAMAFVASSVILWNYMTLQVPMDDVIAGDPRNNGIKAKAHFGTYCQPSVLVFDLQEVSGEKSPSDIFRLLLQFSSAVSEREREFRLVQLAHRGKTKFLLEGSYFSQIGKEYGVQNPLYTMRTFPEHLLLPSGERAYGTWTGGWLGVATKQLDDFGDFHKKWYVLDMAQVD